MIGILSPDIIKDYSLIRDLKYYDGIFLKQIKSYLANNNQIKKKSILFSALILCGVLFSGYNVDAWRGKIQTIHYSDSGGDAVDIVLCKYHLFIKECDKGEGDVIPL